MIRTYHFIILKKALPGQVRGLDKAALAAFAVSKERRISSMTEGAMCPMAIDGAAFVSLGSLDPMAVARIRSNGRPLFADPEVQGLFPCRPYDVGKEGFTEAIRLVRSRAEGDYRTLLQKRRGKREEELLLKTRRTFGNIAHDGFVNLDPAVPFRVTDSSCPEHWVFNLVHIYKTTDWGQETALFYSNDGIRDRYLSGLPERYRPSAMAVAAAAPDAAKGPL